MGGLRIRWTAAARAVVMVLGVTAAALVLPGFLGPPAPPPVPRSVGLAGVVRPTPPDPPRRQSLEAILGTPIRAPAGRPQAPPPTQVPIERRPIIGPEHPDRERATAAASAPATSSGASTPPPAPPAPSVPPAASVPSAPAPYVPRPPAPPPPPTSDGAEEFAPR